MKTRMKTKLRRRLGISTVITTIIILVASVVLAASIVLYSGSLIQSQTAIEGITISGVKLFVHDNVDLTAPDGLAWGAFGVRNSGDKIVSLDKISVRGNDVGFSSWYSNKTVLDATFDAVYTHPGWSGTAGGLTLEGGLAAVTCEDGTSVVQVNVGGPGFCAKAQTGALSLDLGERAVIYFKMGNGTLTSTDAGASTTISIFAGNAGAPLSVTVKGQS